MSEAGGIFAFVQFEFGFLLGPPDGRFISRQGPETAPDRVLVFATLGAPERRQMRGRRGAVVSDAEPEPVPTSRVTAIRPERFSDRADAEGWLEALREDATQPGSEVADAVGVINRAMHAHRVARIDHCARDISADQALVVRLGFGAGEAVVKGHYGVAWELPRETRGRVRRSMEAPEERFAALVGAREPVLVCEELVLRARTDLDAGRFREAALQARVALESLLSELDETALGDRRAELEVDRGAIGKAANVALRGALDSECSERVEGAVARMEAALRIRRLDSAS